MFIGHFGVALAAKRLASRTSLGTLVGAAQLLDLVWSGPAGGGAHAHPGATDSRAPGIATSA